MLSSPKTTTSTTSNCRAISTTSYDLQASSLHPSTLFYIILFNVNLPEILQSLLRGPAPQERNRRNPHEGLTLKTEVPDPLARVILPQGNPLTQAEGPQRPQIKITPNQDLHIPGMADQQHHPQCRQDLALYLRQHPATKKCDQRPPQADHQIQGNEREVEE